MKTVEYSPHGESVPDWQTEARAREFLTWPGDGYFHTSSENFVTAVRVLVAEKVISHELVTFLFEGQTQQPTAEGRLEHWPNGFCDTNERYLMRLIEVMYPPPPPPETEFCHCCGNVPKPHTCGGPMF